MVRGWGGEGEGGTLDFQVTGMIERFFFGFEIFDSGMFLGSKIGQICFWVFSVFNTI